MSFDNVLFISSSRNHNESHMVSIALAMEAHRNEQASSLNCGFHRREIRTEKVSFEQAH